MSATTRHDRARLLCKRLSDDINAVCPPGLGEHPRAWEIVEQPSKVFLDLLGCWERGNDAIKPELRIAYDDVVKAWRRAASEVLGYRAKAMAV